MNETDVGGGEVDACFPGIPLDNVGVAFAVVTVAGLATTVGAVGGLFALSDRALGGFLAMASGVMIYISLIEIVQKSVDSFSACQDGAALPLLLGNACFFLGTAFTVLLDRVAAFLVGLGGDSVPFQGTERALEEENESENDGMAELDMYNTEGGDMAVSEEAKYDVSSSTLLRTGLLTALAIAGHNLPEGLATFAAVVEDLKVGLNLAVSIILHNLPEGLAVGAPLYYATGSKLFAFGVAAATGLTELLGALLGYLLLAELANGYTYGIIYGVVAGMMVYISVMELLPRAYELTNFSTLVVGLGFYAGMAIMALSLVLFEL
mmetsp:Transcript_36053/g.101522  ORF Transcript_36053/g.101522 Transcript_36053/m.101522 type:complete len:322 (-) Transcript_36053:215-1180(-)